MTPAGGGFEHSDNAQTAVDAEQPIIVAAESTDNAADSGQLPTPLEAVGRNFGMLPAQALTAAGYRSDARLQTDAGKAAYRRRKAIVEPPNGWIKAVLGFRPFSFRGIEQVRAEWQFVCVALNLRRMALYETRSQPNSPC